MFVVFGHYRLMTIVSRHCWVSSVSTQPYLNFLIHGNNNLLTRLNFSLDGLIHPFCFNAWNPDFTALVTNLDRNFFKEIEAVFYHTINGDSLYGELPATNGTQRIFHILFSLLVFGSSHLAGSSQWTVII